ncbi:Serine protease inhibitor, potato inhibitor I-type family protein [Prunus dulcis]|uniref:Serine protease inhibitor, potato inhibitor I-type family protein n=1 Tax=Prunus dulcis TaxID=3755 RepID=A0A5H2XMV7_PRUDU|nr:Serine protease inhibitor, potato inhibitor I-type family protein [Prunus dulcis]
MYMQGFVARACWSGGEVAKATIERENPIVTAKIVVEGETYVITNYDCYRVWVWVDKDDRLVTRPPIIG